MYEKRLKNFLNFLRDNEASEEVCNRFYVLGSECLVVFQCTREFSSSVHEKLYSARRLHRGEIQSRSGEDAGHLRRRPEQQHPINEDECPCDPEDHVHGARLSKWRDIEKGVFGRSLFEDAARNFEE